MLVAWAEARKAFGKFAAIMALIAKSTSPIKKNSHNRVSLEDSWCNHKIWCLRDKPYSAACIISRKATRARSKRVFPYVSSYIESNVKMLKQTYESLSSVGKESISFVQGNLGNPSGSVSRGATWCPDKPLTASVLFVPAFLFWQSRLRFFPFGQTLKIVISGKARQAVLLIKWPRAVSSLWSLQSTFFCPRGWISAPSNCLLSC